MFYICFQIFSVGLSAGTGLGVSSALVQNTGNETTNQGAHNNNPPLNQGPANNQPPVNQNGDNAEEGEGNLEGDDDLVEQDADNGHIVPVYGPINQQHMPNPNVGEEMEVDAIENDALNDDHDKPCTVQHNMKCNKKELNNKNVGYSNEDESDLPKPSCSYDFHKGVKSSKTNNTSSSTKNLGSKSNDPDAGPSGVTPTSGMHLRPRSSAGIVTPKKDENRRRTKDAGEFEHDSNTHSLTKPICSQIKRTKSNQADQKTSESSGVKDELLKENCQVNNNVASKTSTAEQSKESTIEKDIKERSETSDGRTSAEKEAYTSSLGLETNLRRSARLSRSQTASEEMHVSKTPVNSSTSSVAPVIASANTSDLETTSPEPGPSRGKSWYVISECSSTVLIPSKLYTP